MWRGSEAGGERRDRRECQRNAVSMGMRSNRKGLAQNSKPQRTRRQRSQITRGKDEPRLMTRGPGNRNPFQATDLSDSTFEK